MLCYILCQWCSWRERVRCKVINFQVIQYQAENREIHFHKLHTNLSNHPPNKSPGNSYLHFTNNIFTFTLSQTSPLKKWLVWNWCPSLFNMLFSSVLIIEIHVPLQERKHHSHLVLCSLNGVRLHKESYFSAIIESKKFKILIVKTVFWRENGK